MITNYTLSVKELVNLTGSRALSSSVEFGLTHLTEPLKMDKDHNIPTFDQVITMNEEINGQIDMMWVMTVSILIFNM